MSDYQNNPYFEAGASAFADGLTKDQCKYAADSSEGTAWLAGWDAAQAHTMGTQAQQEYADATALEGQPQVVQLYNPPSTPDPRMTHHAMTEAEENEMIAAGKMADPRKVEEKEPVPSPRPVYDPNAAKNEPGPSLVNEGENIE